MLYPYNQWTVIERCYNQFKFCYEFTLMRPAKIPMELFNSYYERHLKKYKTAQDTEKATTVYTFFQLRQSMYANMLVSAHGTIYIGFIDQKCIYASNSKFRMVPWNLSGIIELLLKMSYSM